MPIWLATQENPANRCRACFKEVDVDRRNETAAVHQAGADGRVCEGSGLPLANDPPCTADCTPTGAISWPAETVPGDGPSASSYVCDDPVHRQETHAWVFAHTGNAGVYQSFADMRGDR